MVRKNVYLPDFRGRGAHAICPLYPPIYMIFFQFILFSYSCPLCSKDPHFGFSKQNRNSKVVQIRILTIQSHGSVHDSEDVVSRCLSVCEYGIWHKYNIVVISEGDLTIFIVFFILRSANFNRGSCLGVPQPGYGTTVKAVYMLTK